MIEKVSRVKLVAFDDREAASEVERIPSPYAENSYRSTLAAAMQPNVHAD